MIANALKKRKNYLALGEYSNDNLINLEGMFLTLDSSLGLWSGAHSSKFSELKNRLLSSVKFNWKFYAIAVKLLNAHLNMCVRKSIISKENGIKLQEALEKIKRDLGTGKITIDSNRKDIFALIKAELEKDLGPAIAQELNIGNSSIENHATLMRIWMRDALGTTDFAIQSLQSAMLDQAEAHVKTIFPSYTLHQVSQPIPLAYQLVSYVEMFSRDRERLLSTYSRVDRSPMGAYTGMGVSLNINRKVVAKELGFSNGIITNAMDAVQSRDFIMEFMSALSICASHVVKIANDLTALSAPGARVVEFNEDQKDEYQQAANQSASYLDILHYIKTKASSISGHCNTVATIMQNTQSTVSQESMEISEIAFTSYGIMINCIHCLSILMANLVVNKKTSKQIAQQPEAFFYDILNWLLENTNLNYVKAFSTAEKIVQESYRSGVKISLLELKDLKKIEPQITKSIFSVLVGSRATITRRSEGGTNAVRIRKHIRHMRKTVQNK